MLSATNERLGRCSAGVPTRDFSAGGDTGATTSVAEPATEGYPKLYFFSASSTKTPSAGRGIVATVFSFSTLVLTLAPVTAFTTLV